MQTEVNFFSIAISLPINLKFNSFSLIISMHKNFNRYYFVSIKNDLILPRAYDITHCEINYHIHAYIQLSH